jgi:hypothetical protein
MEPHLPASPEDRPVAPQDDCEVGINLSETPFAAQVFGDHFHMLLNQRTQFFNRRAQIATPSGRAQQHGSQILIHSTGN